MTQRAVFLDRDGTLVHARHYPCRPEDLVLYEGICPWLRVLQQAGLKLVVVTNQSGIARGFFTEDDLQQMHAALSATLAASGVTVDGYYFCPHHPDGVIPGLAVRCDCRKPQPGMALRAARDLDITLANSWFLGDILDDIEAGNRVGCRTVLVDLGTESAPTLRLRTPDFVARDMLHALQIVASLEGLVPAPDLAYQPESWRATRRELLTASGSGGSNALPG
jgi:D-glycero-D-manno-heptose 1,7-bisphosphate phosphatase